MRERLARLAVAKSASSAAFSVGKMPRSVARAATRARSYWLRPRRISFSSTMAT